MLQDYDDDDDTASVSPLSLKPEFLRFVFDFPQDYFLFHSCPRFLSYHDKIKSTLRPP